MVIGETTPGRALFLAKRPPRLGEFVIIEHDEGFVLGMVEDSVAGSPFISDDSTDIEAVSKMLQIVGRDRFYLKGSARTLSRLEDLMVRRKVRPVKTPPRPGARVFEADEGVLNRIFTPPGRPLLGGEAYYDEKTRRGYVRIGSLATNPNVPVYVSVDKLVARHCAVLAMTGAGKSNAVAVLSNRIARAFGGTIVIFDFHGEYLDAFDSEVSNVIEPRINPDSLKLHEIGALASIVPSYHKQYRALRALYGLARALRSSGEGGGKNVVELMIELADAIEDREAGEGLRSLLASSIARPERLPSEAEEHYRRLVKLSSDVLHEVAGKLEDLLSRYRGFLSSSAPRDLSRLIVPRKLNVVDLSHVDREGCDVFVSFVSRSLLEARKRWVVSGGREGYPTPALLVLEEAHTLVPKGEEQTNTKTVFSQIAREGRKFGVGLCLVSQRPKSLDENSLSQTCSKIVLRIVEPEDQYYVQRTSEQLSRELVSLLPSLDVGEAVVFGEFALFPALVKIDEFGAKSMGRDPDVVGEWLKTSRESGRELDEFIEMQFSS
ncbi:MAG: ATP-binding protein [Fervidicoccaceae archaeon]